MKQILCYNLLCYQIFPPIDNFSLSFSHSTIESVSAPVCRGQTVQCTAMCPSEYEMAFLGSVLPLYIKERVHVELKHYIWNIFIAVSFIFSSILLIFQNVIFLANESFGWGSFPKLGNPRLKTNAFFFLTRKLKHKILSTFMLNITI